MEEIIDVSNDRGNEIPDGEFTFRILGIRKADAGMYIWNLSYDGGKEGDQILFPNVLKPLLKVLGCKEKDKDHMVWDRELMVGKTFIATVFRNNKGYQNMKDFKKSKESADVPY